LREEDSQSFWKILKKEIIQEDKIVLKSGNSMGPNIKNVKSLKSNTIN